jgi:predicted dehydrogenase
MLKIGIFGVGHLGKFHISNWQTIANVSIVGFYDPNDTNAAEAINKFGLKRYDDIHSLLDAVDAVDIITPTQDNL